MLKIGGNRIIVKIIALPPHWGRDMMITPSHTSPSPPSNPMYCICLWGVRGREFITYTSGGWCLGGKFCPPRSHFVTFQEACDCLRPETTPLKKQNTRSDYYFDNCILQNKCIWLPFESTLFLPSGTLFLKCCFVNIIDMHTVPHKCVYFLCFPKI